MKRSLIFALIIGAAISGTLLMLDQLSGSELVYLDWEMPGIAAAYLFWSAAGCSVAVGVTICWLVNAVVYAAPAFVLFFAVQYLKQRLALQRQT